MPSPCMASRRCRPISRIFPMSIRMRRRAARSTMPWPGTFDSLNPFIVQGDAARGLFDAVFGNNVFETLMMRSRDEAFTLYPLAGRRRSRPTPSAASSSSRSTRAREILRRQAGHAGGRDLHAASCCATRARPLYQALDRRSSRQDGKGRRARRPPHLQRQGRTANCRCSSACCRSCPSMRPMPTPSTSRR